MKSIENEKSRISYGNTKKTPVSDEELELMKNDIATYEKFMSLPKEQRAVLFPVYIETFDASGLANIWDVDVKKIYGLRYQLKKVDEKEQKKSKKKNRTKLTPQPVEEVIKEDVVSNEEIVIEETPVNVIDKKTLDDREIDSAFSLLSSSISNEQDDDDNMYITISKRGSSNDIIRKLESLIVLLEEGKEYSLSITIRR